MFADQLIIILILAIPLNVIASMNDIKYESDGSTLLTEDAKVVVPLQHHPLLLIERGKTSSLAMPKVIEGKVKVGFLDLADLKLACPVPTYQKDRIHPDHQEKWTVKDKLSDGENLVNNMQRKVPNLWRAKCRDEVRPLWRATNKKCHGSAEYFDVGFEVFKGLDTSHRTPKKGFDWYQLYSVCYEPDTLNTFYTKHVIHGPSVEVRRELLKSLIAYEPYYIESSTKFVTQDSGTGSHNEERCCEPTGEEVDPYSPGDANPAGPETSATAQRQDCVIKPHLNGDGGAKSLDALKVRRIRDTFEKSQLDGLYDISHQKKIMTDVVGGNQLTRFWDGLEKVLVKGFLVPPGDMAYPSWDAATLFDFNIVPIWSEIAGRNWRKLEEYVRLLAAKMGGDVVVYSGAYDTLRLRNEERRPKSLTLQEGIDPHTKLKKGDDTKFVGHRVPYYIWKIVYLPEMQEGIAFLVLNNPNAQNSMRRICEDLCNSYGWSDIESEEPQKGLTFCCDVTELRKLSKTNFPRIKVKKILNGKTRFPRVHND